MKNRLLARVALCAVFSFSLLARAAEAEPALWRIKQGGETIYLFGSIHLLKPDTAWMSPKIRKAFDESADLTLEIAGPDDQATALPLIKKYGVDAQHPLSAKLPTDENARLAALSSQLGVPRAMFEPMRPWLAGLTVSMLPLMKQGFDPNAGVERVLKQAADLRHAPVLAFETLDEQLRYFAEMPDKEQIAFLHRSMIDAPKVTDDINKLEAAWEAGDLDALARFLNADMKADDAALYDILVTRRNQDFARQIAEQLKTGKGVHFIAVGAGHLAGPDSVQAQLEKLGIKAERI